MKFKSCLLISLFVLGLANAQKQGEVLFSINGKPTGTAEFLRVYQKNLDLVLDENQKDIETYLQTYIDYKLKVNEAYNLGLHKKESYVNEFNGYKKQLAKGYLADKNTSEALVAEAYQRLLFEVNADHILVRVDEFAPPKDTLEAFNKIHEIHKQLTPENFEEQRQKVNDGTSVLGEKLGYFSVFTMVYPFESMAYTTPVGAISKPFRTRFGYHIIKVNDKKKNPGEVEVAHIMVFKTKPDEPQFNPQQRINDIYQKLKSGEGFESLAKLYSDDKSSGFNGGNLPRFGTGKINSPVFEQKAFTIEEGKYSEPFETEFGWHILKGIKKYPIGGFEQEKAALQEKVNRDQRSSIVTENFVNKLKSEYNFKEDIWVKKSLFALVDSSFTQKKWQKPVHTKLLDKTLFSLRGLTVTANEFANHLLEIQPHLRPEKPEIIVPKIYKQFVQDKVLGYHEANLENINEEYAAIVNEYREGLLLFDLMQEKIWDKARTDTLALKAYFENNREKYTWGKRVVATSVSCNDTDIAADVAAFFGLGYTDEEIKQKLPNENLIFTKVTLEENNQLLPKNFECTPNAVHIHKTEESNIVLYIHECLPRQAKSFEDAQGQVLSDYQNELEKNWVASLRASQKVEVNQKALSKLTNNLKK